MSMNSYFYTPSSNDTQKDYFAKAEFKPGATVNVGELARVIKVLSKNQSDVIKFKSLDDYNRFIHEHFNIIRNFEITINHPESEEDEWGY